MVSELPGKELAEAPTTRSRSEAKLSITWMIHSPEGFTIWLPTFLSHGHRWSGSVQRRGIVDLLSILQVPKLVLPLHDLGGYPWVPTARECWVCTRARFLTWKS